MSNKTVKAPAVYLDLSIEYGLLPTLLIAVRPSDEKCQSCGADCSESVTVRLPLDVESILDAQNAPHPSPAQIRNLSLRLPIQPVAPGTGHSFCRTCLKVAGDAIDARM